MGPILFRSALPDDAESVADVYLRSRRELVAFAPLAHTDNEVRAWIRESLIPEGDVTVAVEAGGVVGMEAVSRNGQFSWIDQLYVDPDWVGRGIGSALLEYARAELLPPIRLYTFQENRRSRRFYEERGFGPSRLEMALGTKRAAQMCSMSGGRDMRALAFVSEGPRLRRSNENS